MTTRQQAAICVAVGLVVTGTMLFSLAAGLIVAGVLLGALAVTSEF